MAPDRSPLSERFAVLRLQAQADRARASAIDALLLGVIILLLGRLERIAQTWHPAPAAETGEDSTRDDASLHALIRLLYVLGPRPNRGMRPHARPTSLRRPRSARAPPSARPPPVGSGRSSPRPPAHLLFRYRNF